MHELAKKVTILLEEAELQRVEQAVIDEDAPAGSLKLLAEVVKPQIDAQLQKGHCRPVSLNGEAMCPTGSNRRRSASRIEAENREFMAMGETWRFLYACKVAGAG